MKLQILCSCLFLQVAVQASSEEIWKWSSSSPYVSSTEASTTTAASSQYRYAGLSTAKIIESDDSYQVSVSDDEGKYLPAVPATSHEVLREEITYIPVDVGTASVNGTYEVFYENPTNEKSLQEEKDNEARSHLKEKLCRLGLAKECIKLTAKSYGVGIDPHAVSYVQPVAIVPVGDPIAAVPLGLGVGNSRSAQHGKNSKGKLKSQPASRFGGPSILPLGPYGGNSLGSGYGGFGSLGSITSLPVPARLPPAPVQHVHQHHQVVASPQIISAPYSVAPPPVVYKSPPSYSPAPQVYQPSPPAYNPPSPPRQEYSNPAPVYNPPPVSYNPPSPPRQEYSNPAPVYNPPAPPRQEYSNPAPSRPYNPPATTSYNNGGNSYVQREQCVCVPIQQCPSYDIIGRDPRNYQIDPRSKLNSTSDFADYEEIVVVKQPEGPQIASNSAGDSIRPRRQDPHRRQAVVRGDSIDPSSEDDEKSKPNGPSVENSEDQVKITSKSTNVNRPQRSALGGPYGEKALLNGHDQTIQRRDGLASEDEVSARTHHYGYGKGFKKAFGKGYGYGVPYPVATPVAVPQPYGVPYAVPQPVPVAQPYAVPQPVPVRVPVIQHVPVQVPVQVPVRVEVPVHVPVRIEVPVRVEVPVPVAAPYPVPVPYEQPVLVHHHYHRQHYAPPAVPLYPPKASVYHSGAYQPPAYGTPTHGYSGPVPSYSTAAASYEQNSYYGAKEAPYNPPSPPAYTEQAQDAGQYSAVQETYSPGQTTGYDSITVQAAPNHGVRASRTNDQQPRTRTSAVRFIESRSGHAESSSSPTASSATSSAVKFELTKRKRSPQKQDYVETEERKQLPSQAEFNADTEGRQVGGYQTCRYSEVCCRSSPSSNRYSSGATPGTCGKRNPQGINGRIKSLPHSDGEAEFAEYPWQVAILKKDQYDNVYVCGGALVGPSHILTVAHCIKGNAPRDLRIRLGEWDVNRESEFYPHIERDVISVIIHPEYYPGNLYNDIAVIKFEGAVDYGYSPHIAPVCVPQRYQDFVGSRCWVSGWGKDAFETGGKYQNILKEVDVTVVGNSECENKLRRTRLGYEFKLHSGFLCAGGEEGKDACKGDGGGPLVCENQGSWFLAGLVSWGIGCGQYDTPGVYTKVSEFSDWVQKMVVF